MFLVLRKEESETHKIISWGEVFSCIDIRNMPKFKIDIAENISIQKHNPRST